MANKRFFLLGKNEHISDICDMYVYVKYTFFTWNR